MYDTLWIFLFPRAYTQKCIIESNALVPSLDCLNVPFHWIFPIMCKVCINIEFLFTLYILHIPYTTMWITNNSSARCICLKCFTKLSMLFDYIKLLHKSLKGKSETFDIAIFLWIISLNLTTNNSWKNIMVKYICLWMIILEKQCTAWAKF